MNHEYWKGELTIYEEEACSTDDKDIVTLWDTGKGIALRLEEGYELKKVEVDENEDDFYKIVKKTK